jgi:opacity protein-like surface antigen
MSVKRNLIIAAAAAFGVSAAYAGGPDMMAAPAASGFTPNFYAELGLGYADTQYEQFMEGSQMTSNTTNPNGGLSYAGDFGYQFMPHLAVELGGGYLPDYDFDVAGAAGNTVSSWYAYGAGRIDTMIKDKINVFAKAGVAYRSFSFSGADASATSDSDYYWGPMFGAGVSYDVRDNIYVAAEYNHLGGTSDSSEGNSLPDANIYMGKVGYKFNF